MPVHLFCKQMFKRNINNCYCNFLFEVPTLKLFLICSYFLPISASFPKYCSGSDVPKLKQLRLKVTSQQATLLINEY